MFARIKHSGLNSPGKAFRLHGMINDGYKKRFRPGEDREDVSHETTEKETFLRKVEEAEIEHVLEGMSGHA
jgi:hypothetical protein